MLTLLNTAVPSHYQATALTLVRDQPHQVGVGMGDAGILHGMLVHIHCLRSVLRRTDGAEQAVGSRKQPLAVMRKDRNRIAGVVALPW